jgi:hypothetical protein
MTLRVWRARIESVVFGKDSARQVTAMFSTEKEAKALSTNLVSFAGNQSVLVAPLSPQDQHRMAALQASEHSLTTSTSTSTSTQPTGSAAQVQHHLQTAAAIATTGNVYSALFCSACANTVPQGAKFCPQCAAPIA